MQRRDRMREVPRMVKAVVWTAVAAVSAADNLDPRPPREAAAVDSLSLTRYVEALEHIQERALFLSGKEDVAQLVTATLKAYLAAQDPFSDYLTKEEYASIQRVREPHYVGIGLEIEKDKVGKIVCFPYPTGPSAEAGIESGDELLTINDASVKGKSLPSVASMAVGAAGSAVALQVRKRQGGSVRSLQVRRAALNPKTVIREDHGTRSVLRLTTFSPGTRREVEYFLSNWPKAEPIIIDLRGTSGGDFHAAVDTAMLFLSKGEPIVSVRGRTGVKSYVNTLVRPPPPQRVFLWQDQGTASAAEVFVAALTENRHAASIGTTTFGKGTRQDIIELQNAGALILTVGYLRTPRGTEFDGHGLAPSYALEDPTVGSAAYFTAVDKLARGRR
jgi:carboxyl-terminal processing protease